MNELRSRLEDEETGEDVDDSEEKLLERIEHDLNENRLIAKLLNTFKENEETNDNDEEVNVDKRFTDRSSFGLPGLKSFVDGNFIQNNFRFRVNDYNLNFFCFCCFLFCFKNIISIVV